MALNSEELALLRETITNWAGLAILSRYSADNIITKKAIEEVREGEKILQAILDKIEVT